MGQRESRLSREIMSALRREGAYCWKNHGSEYTTAGLPDITGCYKGQFFAFETKLPEKRTNTSPKQDRELEKIQLAGGKAQVVCTVAEALEAMLSLK